MDGSNDKSMVVTSPHLLLICIAAVVAMFQMNIISSVGAQQQSRAIDVGNSNSAAKLSSVSSLIQFAEEDKSSQISDGGEIKEVKLKLKNSIADNMTIKWQSDDMSFGSCTTTFTAKDWNEYKTLPITLERETGETSGGKKRSENGVATLVGVIDDVNSPNKERIVVRKQFKKVRKDVSSYCFIGKNGCGTCSKTSYDISKLKPGSYTIASSDDWELQAMIMKPLSNNKSMSKSIALWTGESVIVFSVDDKTKSVNLVKKIKPGDGVVIENDEKFEGGSNKKYNISLIDGTVISLYPEKDDDNSGSVVASAAVWNKNPSSKDIYKKGSLCAGVSDAIIVKKSAVKRGASIFDCGTQCGKYRKSTRAFPRKYCPVPKQQKFHSRDDNTPKNRVVRTFGGPGFYYNEGYNQHNHYNGHHNNHGYHHNGGIGSNWWHHNNNGFHHNKHNNYHHHNNHHHNNHNHGHHHNYGNGEFIKFRNKRTHGGGSMEHGGGAERAPPYGPPEVPPPPPIGGGGPPPIGGGGPPPIGGGGPPPIGGGGPPPIGGGGPPPIGGGGPPPIGGGGPPPIGGGGPPPIGGGGPDLKVPPECIVPPQPMLCIPMPTGGPAPSGPAPSGPPPSGPPPSGPPPSGPPPSGPPPGGPAPSSPPIRIPPECLPPPPKGGGPAPSGPPLSGPPPSGPPPSGPPQGGPPPMGPPPSGPPQGGPPPMGPPPSGPPQGGPPPMGPPPSGPPQGGPAPEGPPPSGPPQGGPAPEGPPPQGGPAPEGPGLMGPPQEGPPQMAPPPEGSAPPPYCEPGQGGELMPGCPPIGGPGGEGMPPQGMPGGEGMPPQGGPSPEGPPLELPPMGGGERQPFLSGAHKSSDIGWSSLLAAVTALIAMLILG